MNPVVLSIANDVTSNTQLALVLDIDTSMLIQVQITPLQTNASIVIDLSTAKYGTPGLRRLFRCWVLSFEDGPPTVHLLPLVIVAPIVLT
jgi:hypothetical protein